MKRQTITGTVRYQHLGPGFWGIIDKNGNQWRPINMPEQLKHEGQEVTVDAKEVNQESIFMWGTPVKILSFHTLTP